MATYVLTIDGTPRAMQTGSVRLNSVINGRDVLNVTVASAAGAYRPTVGDEVVLTEDATAIFGGTITRTDEQGADGHPLAMIATEITCDAFNALADRVTVTEEFPDGETLEDVLTVLVGYLSTLGVTLDAGQVTGPTLPALSFALKRVSDVLDQLTTITTYYWEIDATKTLRMVLPGTDAAPFNIAVGTGSHVGDLEVTRSRQSYVNRVIVQAGASVVIEKIQSFVGDGSTDTFPLLYAIHGPIAPTDDGAVGNAVVDYNTYESLGGLSSVDLIWEYDPVALTITRRTGAPGNGDPFQIRYDVQFPITVTAEDAAEITANGVSEAVVAYPDVYDYDQALAIAESLLSSGLETRVEVTYQTYGLGLAPGQSQTITASHRSVSGTYLITEINAFSSRSDARLRRTVRAILGDVFRGSFRETYKLWAKVGESGASTGSASVGALSSPILSGPYASLPAPATFGRLYLTTDTPLIYRDNGFAFENWGFLKKFTPPDDADFSWLNQDVATINSTYGYPYMQTAVTGSTGTFSAHARMKTNPSSAAFTLTAVFVPTMLALANTFLGFCMRETSSGRLQTYGWESNASVNRIFGLRWLSATSRGSLPAWSGGSPNFYNFNGAPFYLRVVYNGSNSLEGQISFDGNHWITTATHDPTASSFMASIDEYGWFISAEQSSGNPDVGCALVHWVES